MKTMLKLLKRIDYEVFVPCFIMAIAILIIIIMVVSSVSNVFNKIDSGIISDKYIISESINSIDGNFHKIPRQFVFEITDGKKHYRFNVTEAEYDRYSIGDHYER